MTAIGQSFDIWQGDSKRIIFEIMEVDDLSSFTIRWAMSRYNHTEPLIMKTTERLGEVEVSDNRCAIILNPEDTAGLEPKPKYYHELELTDYEGHVVTAAVGTIRLHPAVID